MIFLVCAVERYFYLWLYHHSIWGIISLLFFKILEKSQSTVILNIAVFKSWKLITWSERVIRSFYLIFPVLLLLFECLASLEKVYYIFYYCFCLCIVPIFIYFDCVLCFGCGIWCLTSTGYLYFSQLRCDCLIMVLFDFFGVC